MVITNEETKKAKAGLAEPWKGNWLPFCVAKFQ